MIDWPAITGLSVEWLPRYLLDEDHEPSDSDTPDCRACWSTDGCDLLELHPGDHLSLDPEGVHSRRRQGASDVFFVGQRGRERTSND